MMEREKPDGGEQIYESWVGREVVYRFPNQHDFNGILVAMNAHGLVVRTRTSISWFASDKPNDYSDENRKSDYRVVPTLYPWHRIQYVRLAEDEEKQMEGG